MIDDNKNGLHDPKEEKYLNPNRDHMRHTDAAYDGHRNAALQHGIGLFLVIFGTIWFLDELGLFPRVSWWSLLAIFGGIWLLKSAKRKGK